MSKTNYPKSSKLISLPVKQAIGLVKGKPSLPQILEGYADEGYQPLAMVSHEGLLLVLTVLVDELYDAEDVAEDIGTEKFEEVQESSTGSGGAQPQGSDPQTRDLGEPEIIMPDVVSDVSQSTESQDSND